MELGLPPPACLPAPTRGRHRPVVGGRGNPPTKGMQRAAMDGAQCNNEERKHNNQPTRPTRRTLKNHKGPRGWKQKRSKYAAMDKVEKETIFIPETHAMCPAHQAGSPALCYTMNTLCRPSSEPGSPSLACLTAFSSVSARNASLVNSSCTTRRTWPTSNRQQPTQNRQQSQQQQLVGQLE